MNNPQQLKERIYALNPELKELSFGCELILKDKEDNVYAKDIYVNLQDVDKDESKTLIRTLHCNMTALGRYKIIGHPITLNEVIYAMREQDGNQDSNILKLCGGSMSMWDYKKTFDQNIAENEELVTFLLSIIK